MKRGLMKYVYLDTETTSLNPGQICQLSYIIEEDKNLTGKNFYFEVENVEPDAEQIHGLSVKKLKELSNGRKFNDIKYELLKDLEEATIIGHNIHFDLRFINSELRNVNINNKDFCTMHHFTNIIKLPGYHDDYKWPRLSELVDFLEITDKEIFKTVKKIFNTNESEFHDSRYDVAATYLCYKKGVKNTLIPKPKDRTKSEEYLDKYLSEEQKQKFCRYTTEYKNPENKVLYHVIKKYFEGAKNILEVNKNEITFKLDKLKYTAYTYGIGAKIESKTYRENGIEKQISYSISKSKWCEAMNEAFDEVEILLMFRNLCCYLNNINKKASYSFPEDLNFIMDNIELRNKARDLGLIFYGTGWGWRLRKNWEEVLEKEFERIKCSKDNELTVSN